MGEFDFTYSVPANFNKRVVQFLQQFGKAHVAQAFQRCEYEYEDLGLAYYAGMKVITGIKMLWISHLKVQNLT